MMGKSSVPLKSVVHYLKTNSLDDQPSCIEFSKAHNSLFVVGSYELDENGESGSGSSSEGQMRNGSLQLYQLATDCSVCVCRYTLMP